MSYTIRVAQFEGPFDLILFFIERDEVDIYDIPITKLTKDFLAYIREIEVVNIDLASEFILVAASLMRIKAKMLLPRKELNEAGEEIDPRQELVQKLIEYKKFKEVVNDLRTLAQQRSQMHVRGDVEEELMGISEAYADEMELESLNLFKLMTVFAKVMNRLEDRERKATLQHQVVRFAYTMEQEKGIIISKLGLIDRIHFVDVFSDCRDKVEAIFRFLGILEMIQLQRLKVEVDEELNNFWILLNKEISEDELKDINTDDLWTTDLED